MNKGQEYIPLIGHGQFTFSNFAFIKRKADYVVISNEIEFSLNPQLVR